MSLILASLHVEQAMDYGDRDEILRAANALLQAWKERWRCPSCGVERTESVCKACRIQRPRPRRVR